MNGAQGRRRGKILLIDDEPALVKVFSRLLGREHDVIAVTSAADALVALEADPTFDLILCDVNMPDVGGLELYQRIRAQWPALADCVVFLSGSSDESSVASVVPPSRWLGKPLETEALRAFIATWLAG